MSAHPPSSPTGGRVRRIPIAGNRWESDLGDAEETLATDLGLLDRRDRDLGLGDSGGGLGCSRIVGNEPRPRLNDRRQSKLPALRERISQALTPVRVVVD